MSEETTKAKDDKPEVETQKQVAEPKVSTKPEYAAGETIRFVNRYPLQLTDKEEMRAPGTVCCELTLDAAASEGYHFFADLIRGGKLIPEELMPKE